MKVYADTSVFGGVHDIEFMEPSKRFFDRAQEGFFQIIISTLILEEIEPAPQLVRSFFEEMQSYMEIIRVSPEAEQLKASYLNHRVLPKSSANDALHVALATVAHCGAIVSWNFKDIVNMQRIPLFNAVNGLNGYGPIQIHSPYEVIHYEKGF